MRAPTGRSIQPLPGHRTSDPWRAPRAAATGVVRDEQGTPIAGAQVCGPEIVVLAAIARD